MSLHSVVGMFEEGSSPEEIAYNRDAVNAQLAEHESRSEEAAQRYERAFPEKLRAKLLRTGRRGG